jgi:hypothetical protein
MRIPLLARGRETHASPAERLLRFRKILKSAQRTPFYRHALRTAGLDTARAVRELTRVEDALERLSVVEADSFPGRVRVRCLSRSSLHNPLPGKASIQFATETNDRLVAILAGTVPSLISLPSTVQVERALIVLTGLREGGLTDSERDRLWDRFGVPVFEQYLGLDGELIARECEAHEGLHIVERNAVLEEGCDGDLVFTSLTDMELPTLRLRTGFVGEIRAGECACGGLQPRIMGLRIGDRSSKLCV